MSDIIEEIKKQITSHSVILYMKGNPEAPQCGFSMRAVQILSEIGEPFAFVDILSNSDIRAYLPKVGNWPTFPQLWVKGELMGGSDIMLEMFEKGELTQIIKDANKK